MSRRATTFLLVIEARPGSAGAKQLRWLLKRLLRELNLRCLDLCQVWR